MVCSQVEWLGWVLVQNFRNLMFCLMDETRLDREMVYMMLYLT